MQNLSVLAQIAVALSVAFAINHLHNNI